MRTPEALETLVDYGIVEEVLRPLMSGKEANVYLVRSGGELRVAKVYKDAQQRSFKQRSEYTEGRTTRNTRDRRAMAKHSEHGRKQDEAAWRSAEVNAIYQAQRGGGARADAVPLHRGRAGDGAGPRPRGPRPRASATSSTRPRSPGRSSTSCSARWSGCSAPGSCTATCRSSTC
jgi:hypothetical protein